MAITLQRFFFLPCNEEKKIARCARTFGNWMSQIAMLITAVKFGVCLMHKVLAFLKRYGHHLVAIMLSAM